MRDSFSSTSRGKGSKGKAPKLQAPPRAEDDLRRKEEAATAALRAIVESASDCISMVASDGTLLQMNPAGLSMFEADKSDAILGKKIYEFIAPEHRDAVKTMNGQVCAGASQHLEFEIIGLRGTRRWVETHARPIQDLQSGTTMQLGVTRDITERRREDSSAYYVAAIVESSDDAIVGKNLNGIIQTWNKGAEVLFGYTAEEAIGKHISLLIPKDRIAEEDHIIGQVRAGKRIEHYETVRRRKDGTLIDVSLTVSAVKDGRGRIIGASKIARDITERRRSEQALRESEHKLALANAALEEKVRERTAALEQALAQMEEFSYSISHDLRAPLRAIEAYSNFLAEDHAESLNAEGRDFLTRIGRNSQRMNRLINDVLALSRLARAEVTLRSIPLQPLIKEILEQSPQLQQPSAMVEVHTPHTVLADDVSLVQAITNLLNNAVKFVSPGVQPHVRVRSEMRNGNVRLWIEDNGIGIPPDQQDKLFGMFQRLKGALNYEGTGIGLAIVRKAVERLGGAAGVESGGGYGSRFWIELKVAGNGEHG